MRRFTALLIAGFMLSTSISTARAAETPATVSVQKVKQTYAELVWRNYKDAYNDAIKLQEAIRAFLEKPTKDSLGRAKDAWLNARTSYGQTEAFRFYEGPIDFVDEAKKQEGPEGRLNAWPLNEAYIDYVKGNSKAGLINNKALALTRESIANANQAQDEADVSTGYHAIEFLLWGQDVSLSGPGARPASDYEKGTPAKDRRRDYLRFTTDLLVDDLNTLVKAWEPNQANYAAEFQELPDKEAFGKILTGLATLSGFELASERMATALDSKDQEDEHSCFSDNTHNDFIYNAKGIKNVYLGHYGDFQGASIDALIREKDPALSDKIRAQLNTTERAISDIPYPVDREVLASTATKGKHAMEAAIQSLQAQADLFKQAGAALGADVEVVSE